MKVGDREISEIIVKTSDGGLITSITDDNIVHAGGYEIILKEKE